MKVFIAVTLVSALFYVAYTLPVMDPQCLGMKCPEEVGACLEDRGCKETVLCVLFCLAQWDDDTTDQKLVVQDCTNMCAYTSGNDVFGKTLACLNGNECLKLPAIPSTCKPPKMAKNITVGEMAGTKWRLRGYNTAYDCYLCQKLSLTTNSFKASFEVLVDGKPKPVQVKGSLVVNSPPPSYNVSVDSSFGMAYGMTFYAFDSVVDGSKTYYLIYYCGTSNTWNYSGAYVLTAAETISDSAAGMIQTSFMNNAGLDFTKFCSMSTTNC